MVRAMALALALATTTGLVAPAGRPRVSERGEANVVVPAREGHQRHDPAVEHVSGRTRRGSRPSRRARQSSLTGRQPSTPPVRVF